MQLRTEVPILSEGVFVQQEHILHLVIGVYQNYRARPWQLFQK